MGRGQDHAAQGGIMPTGTLVESVTEEFVSSLEGIDTFPVLANNLPFSSKFFLLRYTCCVLCPPTQNVFLGILSEVTSLQSPP